MLNHKTRLAQIAKNPQDFVFSLNLKSGEQVVLRPLLKTDIKQLTNFLENLSLRTRAQSNFPSYDAQTAIEFCEAINRYDKLRFVLEDQEQKIIGLLEFSFDIPQTDSARYENYGLKLNNQITCRFGPTLADKYQDQGLGSLVFKYMIKIAKFFEQKNMILYGGVLADNARAIHFYQKIGFKKVGEFINQDQRPAVDMILKLE